MYSGIDFSGLGIYLVFALAALILCRLVMLFTGFASEQRRVIANYRRHTVYPILGLRL